METLNGGSSTASPAPSSEEGFLLAKVRDGYRKRARGTAEEIVQRLAGSPGLEDWTWVKSNAHRLRGSGGSYGLPEVTEIAGRLEDAALSLDVAASRRLASELVAAL